MLLALMESNIIPYDTRVHTIIIFMALSVVVDANALGRRSWVSQSAHTGFNSRS